MAWKWLTTAIRLRRLKKSSNNHTPQLHVHNRETAMNTTTLTGLAALLLALPLATFTAIAAPAAPGGGAPQSGFSAEATLGVAVISGADNLSPDLSSSTLGSLRQEAKTTTRVLPVLLPELRYRFGDEGRSSWYLKTMPVTDAAGYFAPTSGLRHSLAGVATIDAGLFFLPMAEVYANPYLVGERRRESDVLSWGGHLVFEDIAGTPLMVQLAMLTADVDNDSLAGLFPSLARDGEIYEVAMSYGLLRSQTMSLSPRLALRRGDMDGAASSYVKIRAELAGTYMAGPLFFLPSVHVGASRYDEKDPVFDSTRRELAYGLNLLVKYRRLMDIDGLGLLGIAAYGVGDANEDFFDSKALVCGLGLSYEF